MQYSIRNNHNNIENNLKSIPCCFAWFIESNSSCVLSPSSEMPKSSCLAIFDFRAELTVVRLVVVVVLRAELVLF